MKALVVHDDYDIRYEEIAEPPVGEHDIKIKVCACGVCGSDFPRMTQHKAHFYPIILGHEFSGYVSQVGKGVTGINVGEKVAVAPLIPCMECEDCKKGYYSLCKHYTFIGSRIQGGFADYIVVPEQNVISVGDSVSYSAAAMLEPATVALHALRHVRFSGDSSVAILGGGTIGLLLLQWAKILGAKQVTVFGRSMKHLQLAKMLGADEIISTEEPDFLQHVNDITGGKGFDYVFESAGAIATLKLTLQLVSSHGTICMVGTPKEEITFSVKEWEQINRKECLLTGSWMSGNAPYPGDEWTTAANSLENGELIIPDEMFYAKIPYCNVEDLVSILKSGEKITGRILMVNEEA